MKVAKRPRALREAFAGTIVITDLVSEQRKIARTFDLGLSGCFVPTKTPFNSGAKIHITIVYAGAKVEALGRVAFARAEGMGINFTKIEPSHRAVLDQWMGDLKAAKSR